jgi:hypothetical protein
MPGRAFSDVAAAGAVEEVAGAAFFVSGSVFWPEHPHTPARQKASVARTQEFRRFITCSITNTRIYLEPVIIAVVSKDCLISE